MKKIVSIALALAMIFTLTVFSGCGAPSKTPDEVLTGMVADIDTMTANLKDETDKTMASFGKSYDENYDALMTLYDDINKGSEILYTNIYNNTYVYLEAVLKTCNTATEEGQDAYYDAVDTFYNEMYDDYWDYLSDVEDYCYDASEVVEDIVSDDYWDDKIGSKTYNKEYKRLTDAESEERKIINDAFDDAFDAFDDDWDGMSGAYIRENYDIATILKERDLSTTVAITSTVEEKEEPAKESDNSKDKKKTTSKKAEPASLTEEMIVGTWEIKSIKYDGSEYTLKEMEKLGEDVDDIKGMTFVIKNGGSAYVYAEGEGDAGEWTISAGKLHIGYMDFKYDNGMLIHESTSDLQLNFEKTSDSQDITEIGK